MARIAEIDRAILAELRKHGRMSFVELAKTNGLVERLIKKHGMQEKLLVAGSATSTGV